MLFRYTNLMQLAPFVPKAFNANGVVALFVLATETIRAEVGVIARVASLGAGGAQRRQAQLVNSNNSNGNNSRAGIPNTAIATPVHGNEEQRIRCSWCCDKRQADEASDVRRRPNARHFAHRKLLLLCCPRQKTHKLT